MSNAVSSAADLLRTVADVRKSFADADAARAEANLKWNHSPQNLDSNTERTRAETVRAGFESRMYSVLNSVFDRIKGSWENAAKGSKMLPFIYKGADSFPTWSVDSN